MQRMIHRAAFAAAVWHAAARIVLGETHESFTEPFRKIELAPAESGLVAEIGVREGDAVRSGQVLASLDKQVLVVSRQIAAVAADSSGRYDAAVAEHRLRESRLRQLRELRSQGHAGVDELQRAEAEWASAAGSLRAVEEQRKIDQLEVSKNDAMIERRLVRSPIDGVVTRIHREQGEFVTPVAPTVVTVTQLHPLRAIFNVTQSDAAALRPEAEVSLQIGERSESVVGRVEFVSPIIDADSGTVRVKILLDNQAGSLQSGERCYLVVGEKTNTPVPTSASTEPGIHVVGSR